MHYLIDGHNLIASIDDISIEDPNDEIKLILRLRRWTASGRKRRVTVIFDRGLPGGEARHLSTGPVKVVFAPEGDTADILLIRRLGKVRNPTAYTLISSDREVLSVARNRGVQHISSHHFAKQLPAGSTERRLDKLSDENIGKDYDLDGEQDPIISKADVAEWLKMFHTDQADIDGESSAIPSGREMTLEEAQRVLNKIKTEPDALEDAEEVTNRGNDREIGSESSSEALKSGARDLSDDEIDDWLDLFAQSNDK